MEPDYDIYLTEENMYAVASNTEWTVKELRELLKEDKRKWRICITGIRVAED